MKGYYYRPLPDPTIENYVSRLETNTRLLEKHPEHKEMFERKINEAKEAIIREAVKMYGKKG